MTKKQKKQLINELKLVADEFDDVLTVINPNDELYEIVRNEFVEKLIKIFENIHQEEGVG